MALSTRKRNLIIADAKAGRFDTVTNLCKHYKINRGTYYKLEKKYGFEFGENAHIVEAAMITEAAKKSTKSEHEIKAIERTVKEKLTVSKMNEKLIENNRKLALEMQKILGKKALNNELPEAKDIKAATSSLMDIERIANPKPELIINNENKQENKIIEVKFV